VAAGVIQAAWERDWKCPGQLSIVGFDDVPLARQLTPPLTTVRQPIYTIAVTAMTMLVENLIPGISTDQSVLVPTEFILRKSTGPRM
jgi:LacI family transcriptional regulator